MANFTVKDPPEYDPALRMLEPTDPNHADTFNTLFDRLINNDVFLATLAQKTAEALLEHCDDGAIHVTAQQTQSWDDKAGTAAATQSAAGLMSAADKTKLDGIAEKAEANQNAYGSIKAGSTAVTANSKTSTLTLEAGANITLSADNAAKKIVIAANRDGGNADTVDGYHATSFAAASEVDALKKSVSDGKTVVANAVTAKGVVTAADATFATIAANIGKISTGVDTSDATATGGEVLSGKTCYVKGAKVTGTMANRGAVTQALDAGGSYTIPAGYHNGAGKVTASSLASQTQADAVASDILASKTAWVKGAKITGNVIDASDTLSITAGPPEGSILTAGWTQPNTKYARVKGMTTHFKIGNVPLVIGLTADKIVEGNTILGIVGTGGGTKVISGTAVTIYEDSDDYYIKLSDYFRTFSQFRFCKIYTQSIPNSTTGAIYHDLLLLWSEDIDTTRSITAFGNRSSSISLSLDRLLSSDGYVANTASKTLAVEYLKRLGRYNISQSGSIGTSSLNKIAVSSVGKNTGQVKSCLIEYA